MTRDPAATRGASLQVRMAAEQLPGFDPDEVVPGFETPADPISGRRRGLDAKTADLLDRLLQLLRAR